MSSAKAALKSERKVDRTIRTVAISQNQVSPRFTNSRTAADQFGSALRAVPAAAPGKRDNDRHFQIRIPVITGEVTYRGTMPVDGVISGQLTANGGALSIKQRRPSAPFESVPELDGEISFKDMVRINGHIAGRIFSKKGTLIIGESAKVDAHVEVGVAMISGTVNGNVIGHERIELGPCAVINGNISTRALTIKPGAIFHGECRMIKNDNGDYQGRRSQ